MACKLDSRGYLRVNWEGQSRTLTAWGNRRLPEHPDLAKDIEDAINLETKLGTFTWEHWFPSEKRKLLFSKILDEWQKDKMKDPIEPPAPATICTQDAHIRHIIDHIGHKSVKSLTSFNEDWDWIREEYKDRPGLAVGIRATAQAALNWALRQGKITTPIFVPRYKVVAQKTPYIEKEDRERILAQVPQPYWGPCVMSVDQGFRIGEILVLRWQDIDFKSNYIHVRRTLSGNAIRETRKAGDAYKPLIWTDRVRDLLLELRRQMRSEWVFVGKFGGRLRRQRTTQKWKEAARKCGLPKARLHDNRHSFIADMLSQGYSLMEAKIQAGHKSSRTTERYAGANVLVQKKGNITKLHRGG